MELDLGSAVVKRALREQHESLVSNYVRRIREDSDFGALQHTNAQELRQLIQDIVIRLSNYLEGEEQELTKCLELVGDACFRSSIPLLETVYALYLLRDLIADAIALDKCPEDVKVHLDRFFDRLVFGLLRNC